MCAYVDQHCSPYCDGGAHTSWLTTSSRSGDCVRDTHLFIAYQAYTTFSLVKCSAISTHLYIIKYSTSQIRMGMCAITEADCFPPLNKTKATCTCEVDVYHVTRTDTGFSPVRLHPDDGYKIKKICQDLMTQNPQRGKHPYYMIRAWYIWPYITRRHVCTPYQHLFTLKKVLVIIHPNTGLALLGLHRKPKVTYLILPKDTITIESVLSIMKLALGPVGPPALGPVYTGKAMATGWCQTIGKADFFPLQKRNLHWSICGTSNHKNRCVEDGGHWSNGNIWSIQTHGLTRTTTTWARWNYNVVRVIYDHMSCGVTFIQRTSTFCSKKKCLSS